VGLVAAWQQVCWLAGGGGWAHSGWQAEPALGSGANEQVLDGVVQNHQWTRETKAGVLVFDCSVDGASLRGVWLVLAASEIVHGEECRVLDG